MGMVRFNHEVAKSDREILALLYDAAKEYNKYVNKKLLFIFREKKKDAPYECYEVFYGKENFIHLAGFKRKRIDAKQFFDKCLNRSISLHEVEKIGCTSYRYEKTDYGLHIIPKKSFGCIDEIS